MKKTLLILAVLLSISSGAHAVIKCVPTPGGGTCCWDTDKDGPFRPIGC